MESVKELNSKNFDSFIKSKNTIVEFGADWCNPCKIFEPIFHAAAKDIKNVKFGSVDVDKENEIAQRFGVMSVPTVIFFKDGEQVDVEIGAISKEEFIKKIKENSK